MSNGRRGRPAGLIGLALIVLLTTGALVATVASGHRPQLGLDLRGGASVVLQPKHQAQAGALDQAIEIIRQRVDALGVAEPDITRQGSTIVVQLPGVKNKDRALELVGQTAQLFFRPVVQELPAAEPPPERAVPAATEGGDHAIDPALLATTAPEDNRPENRVVLPERDRTGRVKARYLLGPSELTGRALATAKAVVDPDTGTWQVDFGLTDGGTRQWNDMAARVGQGNRIAMDLDGEVRSAPTLQTTNFPGNGRITGTFTQGQAKGLALVLRYGSLPVQLQAQTVQTVSASLGKDSLRAGVVAGVVGLALVAAYMTLYYRALGLVVWMGLAVSGALMYSLVTLLGRTSGLALTLAGATGIIVSVGVTVDSYVVFFERLKDEVRAGRTIRSSVERSFSRAYRTILAADAASFIGAVVLYWLSVGSVRGFALFLALSTLLDVFIAYFFTRPVVMLLGRNRFFTDARWVGVARGLGAVPPGDAASEELPVATGAAS